MSQLLYAIISITIGIIIFYIKPKWFFFYWLLFEPLLFPIGCLMLGIVDREAFVEFYKYNNSCARNLLLLVLLIEFCSKRRFPNVRKIWFSLAVLMIYLIVHNILNHFDIGTIWGYLSQQFSLILVLLILLFDKSLIPSQFGLSKFLLYLVLVQFIFVIANKNGIYVYITYYIPVLLETSAGAMYESFTENLAMGTFQSFNSLANFLTTVYLIVSLEFFSKKSISGPYFLLFSIVIGFMVVSTGARASVVMCFIILLLSNLVYLKSNYKFFLGSSILFLASLLFFITYDSYGVQESEDGINRIFVGMSNFLQSNKDDDFSTVSYSTYLIDNYFYDSPIIGNGFAYKGEFAYGNKGVVGLTNFFADARLAFLLVEFGIVGFLLYMYFFSSIFSFLKMQVINDDKRKLIVFFAYFFILTITENGFFDRVNLALFYIYTFSFLKKEPTKV